MAITVGDLKAGRPATPGILARLLGDRKLEHWSLDCRSVRKTMNELAREGELEIPEVIDEEWLICLEGRLNSD